MNKTVRIQWRRPSGWHSVVAAELAAGRWRHGAPAELPTSELDRFEAYVASQPPRHAWVLVVPPASPQLLLAVGWLDAGPGPDLGTLAEPLAASADGLPPSILSRQVTRAVISDQAGLVCVDVAGSETEGIGLRLHERALAVKRYEETGINVALEISTSDLSGFEDIGATTATALAGVTIEIGAAIHD